MSMTRVLCDNGLELFADLHRGLGPEGDLRLDLSLRGHRGPCTLHWGLSHDRGGRWRAPERELWPQGTQPFDRHAVQTAFPLDGEPLQLEFPIALLDVETALAFVLYLPARDRWLNNGGANYRLELPSASPPGPALQARLDDGRGRPPLAHGATSAAAMGLGHGERPRLVWRVDEPEGAEGARTLRLLSDLEEPLSLHWGLTGRRGGQWRQPKLEQRPEGSEVHGDRAVQTPMHGAEGAPLALELSFDAESCPEAVAFVLHAGDRWLKDQGRDFIVDLCAPRNERALAEQELDALCGRIVEAETERGSWTLMHRFGLCRDLLDEVGHDPLALTTLYCWLRYSALRQLDWQRRYNTKPRELAHAQDRLTQGIAEVYGERPQARPWARLLLTTLGRGSDGQRVRDEILEIMHRHKIKEVTGHFMEEWHQKLHNNTTPDDIAICEAYLAYLRSDGDLETFYASLETAGVTRERLRSYERPIVTDPDFRPELKSGLLHDFERYLLTLKRVHEGSDLRVAVEALGEAPAPLRRLLESILESRDAHGDALFLLVARIVEARRRVAALLVPGEGPAPDARRARDMLFVDIALENTLRLAVERDASARRPLRELLLLVAAALENVALSCTGEAADELSRALKHLHQLGAETGEGGKAKQRDWALRAKAVADRCGRALGTLVDSLHQRLQPRAEALGQALGVERWTMELFAEEVLRGRPAFALAAALKRLDPPLRANAELGDWQVVAPGAGHGRLRVVDTLRAVQAEVFRQPTVLVATQVGGDEEIPAGVVAVLTPDSTDLVSHVAVRARNGGVLFATCYSDETLAKLRALAGETLRITSDVAGDVTWEHAAPQGLTQPFIAIEESPLELPPLPPFEGWVLPRGDFAEGRVGGKSMNVRRLVGSLPPWVELPSAVALPFGCFEQTLAAPQNATAAARYRELEGKLERRALQSGLAELKACVESLEAPSGLEGELRSAIDAAGLPWPGDFARSFACIKKVWASKWNERATLSREARRIPHERLAMAVLVQEIMPAELAFVLHTVNPLTGDPEELYGEVVVGLGETLVGNYPGRAMGFVAAKSGATPPRVIAYPSKSIALTGSGLIFRSDSNGEDLSEYAGAGLYDSVPQQEARRVHVEYTAEPLLSDSQFRHALLRRLTELGRLVETHFGAAQDIEGTFGDGRYHVVQTRPQVGLSTAEGSVHD